LFWEWINFIKAVVFDLDGTLLNRDASVKIFLENQYKRLNKSVNHISKDNYITRFIELDSRGYVFELIGVSATSKSNKSLKMARFKLN